METYETAEQKDMGSHGKTRRRALSIIIVTATLAAVLLLNVLLGLLVYKKVAYIDLTQPKYTNMTGFYTFSSDLESVMESSVIPSIDGINSDRQERGLDPLKVQIIFCRDSDLLDADSDAKQVHHTAKQLRSKYPDHIELLYRDVVKDPSSVSQYKVTSATSIYASDVIIAFGTEFNVHGLVSFFTLDSDTGETWGYNGEKKFASTILSLTRTDTPVCALTTNHGEQMFKRQGENISVRDEYSAFLNIIEGAGYKIELIDLENDPIPDNCRMMICFAPTSDLTAFGSIGGSGSSEIQKLDKYLDSQSSFFYITDPSVPPLPNLEEYLSEWGIAPAHVSTASGEIKSYVLKDRDNCIDGEGALITGRYETEGYGASITADLRDLPYTPSAVFGSSTAILPSPNYDREIILPDSADGKKTAIYSYYNNGVYRTMYDILTANSTSSAMIDGDVYEHASENNLFRLFTLTEESRQIQEDSYGMVSLSSYVLAMSSTDFFKNQYLDSAAYGNADILLCALRATGTETVPVNIDPKAYYSYEIDADSYIYTQTTAYKIISTICALLPAVATVTAGVVVCVKRKYL